MPNYYKTQTIKNCLDIACTTLDDTISKTIKSLLPPPTNNDGDDAINIIIMFRPASIVTVVYAIRGENVRNSRTFSPLLTAARTRGAQNLGIANINDRHKRLEQSKIMIETHSVVVLFRLTAQYTHEAAPIHVVLFVFSNQFLLPPPHIQFITQWSLIKPVEEESYWVLLVNFYSVRKYRRVLYVV